MTKIEATRFGIIYTNNAGDKYIEADLDEHVFDSSVDYVYKSATTQWDHMMWTDRLVHELHIGKSIREVLAHHAGRVEKILRRLPSAEVVESSTPQTSSISSTSVSFPVMQVLAGVGVVSMLVLLKAKRQPVKHKQVPTVKVNEKNKVGV